MSTPLIKRLEALKKEDRISFHTPGHKKGSAYESIGDGGIKENLYQYDTTEVFGTDQLQDPTGVLQESQQWTATVFNSPQAYYLVNGSTSGVLGMILSQTKPKDEVLVQRDVHQSVIHALILGDLTPRFIQPEIDPLYKIPKGITALQVKEGLEKYPDCKGVLVTHPNYYGRGAELEEIRRLTKEGGKIFWVDQAHGAHLGLHRELPLSGVAVGADLTVMSFHKTLPVMSQSAVLFSSGDLVDRERLQEQLNIHQSSSPSYILMASIEQGTRYYREVGEEKMALLMEQIRQFENKFKSLRLFQLDPSGDQKQTKDRTKDPTKLWIHTEDSGLSGHAVEAYLRENHGIDMELSMPQGLLGLTSMGNRGKDLEKLYLAFEELEESLYNKGKIGKTPAHENFSKEGFFDTEVEVKEEEVTIKPGDFSGIPIRTAFYSAKERVSINKSMHRVAGSAVTPYPPGIPLILPGEVIRRTHIKKLLEYERRKIKIIGIKAGKIMVITEE